MTYKEIIDRVNEKINKAGILKQDIAAGMNIDQGNLSRMLQGAATKIYRCLDLLDEVGLELTLNNKPMRCHQDVLDYALEYRLESMRKIGDKSGVGQGTVNKFFVGENVGMESALKIFDVLGIEVRVV